ncbi:MAG: DNA polymerase III subunit beta [Burkholderiales bacterium]|nr:DNA polymerase III subunit beta [Burkholderiales bacterium]
MNLVTADRDTLLKPIQTVSGIVERRHTLPILSNLLLTKAGGTLTFLATDIEVQVSTRAECEAGSDVATTVAARKLLDILRALPGNVPVSLDLNNKKLSIKSGRSRFSLQTLGAEDFPTVAPASDFRTGFSVGQRPLKALLSLVQYAMAQQDIRYYLNGLLLIVEKGQAKVVATDGHRLAYAALDIEGEHERQEVIIPRKTIIELERLLEDSDEPIRIDIASTQVRFQFGNVELVSKLVEGKFPDYQRVIPSGYKNSFRIAREELIGCLQRAAILTNEKFKGVRCVLGQNSLKISCTNTDQEEAQEEAEIEYGGDAIDIGFNVTYLLDVLMHVKSETVTVSLGDANSSALITLEDTADFRYVVMPMRI